MSQLHTTVLSPEQCKIFPVLREARKRGFYLVGGTAIALHIGHRKSIDFDLFRDTSFYTETISKILIKAKVKLSSVHQYKTDNVTGIID